MQGGERHDNFDYPDTEWLYYCFAERFGWKPNEVDHLPAATADWLLAIGGMIDNMKAED